MQFGNFPRGTITLTFYFIAETTATIYYNTQKNVPRPKRSEYEYTANILLTSTKDVRVTLQKYSRQSAELLCIIQDQCNSFHKQFLKIVHLAARGTKVVLKKVKHFQKNIKGLPRTIQFQVTINFLN